MDRNTGQKRYIIDIHAHILPGIDDGARDMEETLYMIRIAVSQGITTIIATPHSSRQRRQSQLQELVCQVQEEINRYYPGFNLYLGQEAFYQEELTEYLKAGKVCCMAGSRYVLLEFAVSVSYESLFRGIRSLTSVGYYPILAHMERYPCIRREERISELTNIGCLFQMNYESLQGNRFSPEVRWCRRQVQSGRIHFLGTDMHRSDVRTPDISRPLKWLENHIDERILDSMTRRNPLRIINNEGINQEN